MFRVFAEGNEQTAQRQAVTAEGRLGHAAMGAHPVTKLCQEPWFNCRCGSRDDISDVQKANEVARPEKGIAVFPPTTAQASLCIQAPTKLRQRLRIERSNGQFEPRGPSGQSSRAT